MGTYTNDFKDMPDLDAGMCRRAQRTVVLDAVRRVMFCQATGRLLDVDTTVVLIPSTGAPVVVDAQVWDEQQEKVTGALPEGVTLEVYDGRELV